MAKKKLLCIVSLLPALCFSNDSITSLEDLMAAQHSIVKQNRDEANKFIREANKNAISQQNRVEKIINDSKENQAIYGNFNWFNELNLSKHNTNAALANKELVLYIFVSLSIAKPRLIELAKDAKNYGAVLVLRGLKNNSYKDTAFYLQDVIKQTGTGFIVEPNLFKEYQVTKVPEFVLSTTVEKKYDKVIGNVTLQYALEEIAQNGELKTQAGKLLRHK